MGRSHGDRDAGGDLSVPGQEPNVLVPLPDAQPSHCLTATT